jgi:hypothetical protein
MAGLPREWEIRYGVVILHHYVRVGFLIEPHNFWLTGFTTSDSVTYCLGMLDLNHIEGLSPMRETREQGCPA